MIVLRVRGSSIHWASESARMSDSCSIGISCSGEREEVSETLKRSLGEWEAGRTSSKPASSSPYGSSYSLRTLLRPSS